MEYIEYIYIYIINIYILYICIFEISFDSVVRIKLIFLFIYVVSYKLFNI